MRYSTYNAIPQYPKSKKHPYETLEKVRLAWGREYSRIPKAESGIDASPSEE